MHFRHLIKDLYKAQENKNDMLEFIRSVLVERQGDCTNVYSPLYETLAQAQTFIKKLIK